MACGTIRWRRYVDASAQSEDQIDVLSLPTFEIFPQWDPIDEVYGVTDMLDPVQVYGDRLSFSQTSFNATDAAPRPNITCL